MSNTRYVNLGDICNSQPNYALTDNTKYIMPLNKVYDSSITQMLQYPGNENMNGVFADNIFVHGHVEPENIKAYNKDFFPHSHNNNFHINRDKQEVNNCNGCKKWN